MSETLIICDPLCEKQPYSRENKAAFCREVIMLKPYSKFEDFILKNFIVTSHFSLVLVQCFSQLVQAVTSHTENCEQLHGPGVD